MLCDSSWFYLQCVIVAFPGHIYVWSNVYKCQLKKETHWTQYALLFLVISLDKLSYHDVRLLERLKLQFSLYRNIRARYTKTRNVLMNLRELCKKKKYFKGHSENIIQIQAMAKRLHRSKLWSKSSWILEKKNQCWCSETIWLPWLVVKRQIPETSISISMLRQTTFEKRK